MNSYVKMIRNRIVDLDEVYNFAGDELLIWIHLWS